MARPERHVPRPDPDYQKKIELLREWVIAKAREQSEARGRFTITDLATEGNTYKEQIAEIVWELETEGQVVSLGDRLGWTWASPSKPPPTLPQLLDFAEAHEDTTTPPGAAASGRKGHNKSRHVNLLTSSQLKDVRWVVGRIAKYEGRGDPSRVPPSLFLWDPAADAGSGNWALLQVIRKWSVSSDSKPKLVRAAELLLDLAATHGLLTRDGRDLGQFEVHSAEWVPILKWMQASISRAQGNRAGTAIRHGCLILGRYATRLGFRSFDSTEWSSVRAEIEKDVKVYEETAGLVGLRPQSAKEARYVWKRIPELEEGIGSWPSARDSRRGLVSNMGQSGSLNSRKVDGEGRTERAGAPLW